MHTVRYKHSSIQSLICLFAYLLICLLSLYTTPSAFADTINTAFGQIDTRPEYFIGSLFSIILSIAGAGALGLIIYGGFQLGLSQGNQEKVQGAKEVITSAIIGLLFVIFSTVILRIIGVHVFGGLGGNFQ